MRTYEQFVHTLDKDRADDRICSLYAEAETKPAGSSAFCILVVPGLPPFFNVNLWRENLHATGLYVPQQVRMCATGAAVGQ
jgi:hypothetical protein